jgi:hypothetical protein
VKIDGKARKSFMASKYLPDVSTFVAQQVSSTSPRQIPRESENDGTSLFCERVAMTMLEFIGRDHHCF